jgi:protein-L-isoaspartate(D-aspartate) O-methyltransferase
MNNQHQRMLDVINSEARFTASYTGRKHFKKNVMQAMAIVPRDEFVPAGEKPFAFHDGPLPIGHGQTISQPYIVALMTDLLELEPDDVVLEIGTGSGYQAAILSLLAKQVYTLERVSDLADSAARRLRKLGYTNVNCQCSDGYNGWSEHAPFDAIVVTAAATHIPPSLLEQLKPGGRLVIPIGMPYLHQELMLVIKDEQGDTHNKAILGVAFVPLVHKLDEPQSVTD